MNAIQQVRQQLKDQALALYQTGTGAHGVAQELGVSIGWVYKVLHAVGLPLHKQGRKPYTRKTPLGATSLESCVLALLPTEMKQQEIADRCGCTRAAVSLILRKHGVLRREAAVAQAAEKAERRKEKREAQQERAQEALRMWRDGTPIETIREHLGLKDYHYTVNWLADRRKEDPSLPTRRKRSPANAEDQLRAMSTAWRAGEATADMVLRFGYRNAESLAAAIYRARKTGYADLFPRRRR